MIFQEIWLKLRITWVLRNSSSCWSTIWYQTWMKEGFFSMTEIHATDCVQYLVTNFGWGKCYRIKNWLTQNPDLKIIEQMWTELRKSIYQKNPCYLVWVVVVQLERMSSHTCERGERSLHISSQAHWINFSSKAKPYEMYNNFLKLTCTITSSN